MRVMDWGWVGAVDSLGSPAGVQGGEMISIDSGILGLDRTLGEGC